MLKFINKRSRAMFLQNVILAYFVVVRLSATSTRVCAFSTTQVSNGGATRLCNVNVALSSTILDDPSASATEDATTHIVFPGGGIFFYWYAGLVSSLRERNYDLSSCTFSGASAGALAATLTGLNVDFYSATDLALTMAADAGVWDRKSGLQGIWGPMIENWLDVLLPESIQPIQGRLTLLVTPVPSFGKVKICSFIDRQDLIRANLASVHLVREHSLRASAVKLGSS
jgi:hypothetical protein